jgi:uncharacterized protein (TIGR04141 family)
MPRKRAISIRLLKAQIVNVTDTLKDGHRLQEVPLSGAPETKRLFAGQAYRTRPKWLSFFPVDEQAAMNDLLGAAPAAVLFVSVTADDQGESARWLAVCFGMGFQALRPEALETSAGLRIALNRIGRQLIKSVDTRRPEDATVQTRSQNSRTGDIFDFGVDTSHIILQAITGKCLDTAFAGTLSGADGLKLNCEVDYSSIDAKAGQIIAAYSDETYRDQFPWFGSVNPIRDRAEIDRFDGELVRRIATANAAGIHLAPPEIVDYQTIDQFKYSGMTRGQDGYDELRLADYLQLFGEGDPPGLARLKHDKVRVKADDQEQFFDRWTIYNCLSAEIELDGTLYVLSAGEWYSVVRGFVDRINREIAQIPRAAIDLPAFRTGEEEGDYNRRAAQEMAGVHLFDRSLINFEGERGRVEFCDLLTASRQIVHVKKRSGSAILSHLFLQGFVSGEAFLDHAGLRDQVRTAAPEAAHLIPTGVPNAEDYEIVYALLQKVPQRSRSSARWHWRVFTSNCAECGIGSVFAGCRGRRRMRSKSSHRRCIASHYNEGTARAHLTGQGGRLSVVSDFPTGRQRSTSSQRNHQRVTPG